MTRSSLLLLAAVLLLAPLVAAQGFFEQFFGHGHQQQRQPGPAEQWRAHGAGIDCPGYLCPVTFDCVNKPAQCPCPAEQDVKCYTGTGEDSYVCVRGDNECQKIKQARKAI